jgi:hypothetical protein
MVAINFHDSDLVGVHTFNLSDDGNLFEAASNLYYILQQAEDLVLKNNLSGIAISRIPYWLCD